MKLQQTNRQTERQGKSQAFVKTFGQRRAVCWKNIQGGILYVHLHIHTNRRARVCNLKHSSKTPLRSSVRPVSTWGAGNSWVVKYFQFQMLPNRHSEVKDLPVCQSSLTWLSLTSPGPRYPLLWLLSYSNSCLSIVRLMVQFRALAVHSCICTRAF